LSTDGFVVAVQNDGEQLSLRKRPRFKPLQTKHNRYSLAERWHCHNNHDNYRLIQKKLCGNELQCVLTKHSTVKLFHSDRIKKHEDKNE